MKIHQMCVTILLVILFYVFISHTYFKQNCKRSKRLDSVEEIIFLILNESWQPTLVIW